MTEDERVVPVPARPELLGVYLNDHLAGAAAGVGLAGRLAGSHRGTAAAADLDQLAAEVREDRNSLIAIMNEVGVDRRHYKEPVAVLAERLGRFKPNGSLLARSPLSSVVELEAMALGVTGKRAGWRTLRELSGSEPRLDAGRLDELIARADRQLALLERLRVRAVAEGLGR
jgi:hypothetical protein